MKLALVLAAVILSLSTPAFTAQQLDLATPITHSAYRVIGLNLDWEGATVTVYLKCTSTGQQLTFTYRGTVATNLMITLNKANLSTNSLQKRILEYLVTDGKLTGTVSGSPD